MSSCPDSLIHKEALHNFTRFFAYLDVYTLLNKLAALEKFVQEHRSPAPPTTQAQTSTEKPIQSTNDTDLQDEDVLNGTLLSKVQIEPKAGSVEPKLDALSEHFLQVCELMIKAFQDAYRASSCSILSVCGQSPWSSMAELETLHLVLHEGLKSTNLPNLVTLENSVLDIVHQLAGQFNKWLNADPARYKIMLEQHQYQSSPLFKKQSIVHEITASELASCTYWFHKYVPEYAGNAAGMVAALKSFESVESDDQDFWAKQLTAKRFMETFRRQRPTLIMVWSMHDPTAFSSDVVKQVLLATTVKSLYQAMMDHPKDPRVLHLMVLLCNCASTLQSKFEREYKMKGIYAPVIVRPRGEACDCDEANRNAD